MYELTRKKIKRPTRKPIVLAIDFDGVIHDYKNPIEGRRMGAPMAESNKSIERLIDKGYQIIIHTVKAQTESGRQAVLDWLDYYDIPYHDVTSVKPIASLYIDDKALRHENWPQTMEAIRELS